MKTQLDREIVEIPHAGLRLLTINALDAAPEYFWRIPASTSGKYHPAFAAGEGGLVRHTQAVFRIARHLLTMHDIGRGEPLYSIVLAAALLHDCCKAGKGGEHTCHEHPLLAAEHITQVARALPPGTVDSTHLRTLLGCVNSHMGRWNKSDYSDIVLPLPRTFAETLLHTADYLASRKTLV